LKNPIQISEYQCKWKFEMCIKEHDFIWVLEINMQGCYKTSPFGAVCVGWNRRSFPSLRSSRFRICAVSFGPFWVLFPSKFAMTEVKGWVLLIGQVQAQPETLQKVCDIVRKQLALPKESELTPDTKFSDLGADSLDTVRHKTFIKHCFLLHLIQRLYL